MTLEVTDYGKKYATAHNIIVCKFISTILCTFDSQLNRKFPSFFEIELGEHVSDNNKLPNTFALVPEIEYTRFPNEDSHLANILLNINRTKDRF